MISGQLARLWINDTLPVRIARPYAHHAVPEHLRDPLYAGCFYFNRRDSKTRKERPQPEWIAVAVPAIIDAGGFERAAKRTDVQIGSASCLAITWSVAATAEEQLRRTRRVLRGWCQTP